jgi:hypothetical protein
LIATKSTRAKSKSTTQSTKSKSFHLQSNTSNDTPRKLQLTSQQKQMVKQQKHFLLLQSSQSCVRNTVTSWAQVVWMYGPLSSSTTTTSRTRLGAIFLIQFALSEKPVLGNILSPIIKTKTMPINENCCNDGVIFSRPLFHATSSSPKTTTIMDLPPFTSLDMLHYSPFHFMGGGGTTTSGISMSSSLLCGASAGLIMGSEAASLFYNHTAAESLRNSGMENASGPTSSSATATASFLASSAAVASFEQLELLSHN